MNETSSPPNVFVVLPAYNERAGIGALLDGLAETMQEAGLPYRAVVVDDGSTDGTWEVLTERTRQMPAELHRHVTNLGLGLTIRDGLLAASQIAGEKDVLVTMDADGTHSPRLIPSMVELISRGYDVVIASRYRRGAKVRGVALHRQVLSLGASWLFRAFFPTAGVRDYTSGYRAYRGAVVKKAFSTFGDRFVEAEGFACMADILLKVRRLGASFTEVPLELRYDLKRGSSKMRLVRTVGQTLSLLVRRRLGF